MKTLYNANKLRAGLAALALSGAIGLYAQREGQAESLLQAAVKKETIDGDLRGAIAGYKKAIAAAKNNRAVMAKALLRLGECYEKQGDAEARGMYMRLVREFGDQKEQASEAQARLAAMGDAGAGRTVAASEVARNIGDDGGRVTRDGKFYLFTDWETGDLAVRDLRSGAVRRLTNEAKDGVYAWLPLASPDGKRIAFAWRGAGRWDLRTVNLDGSGLRTVPQSGMAGIHDWTGDGRAVLVSTAKEGSGLATIDVATGESRSVPGSAKPDEVAGYSPDGRWIVYAKRVREGQPDFDIFAVDVQTGKETLLVGGASADRGPTWVPGASKLLFRSDRGGKSALWVVDFANGVASGAPRLAHFESSEIIPKGITADGSVYYAVSHESFDIHEAAMDPVTLRVAGQPRRILEKHRGRNLQPQWSPDGKSFAYTSTRATGDFQTASRLVIQHEDGLETVVDRPYAMRAHWCGPDRLALNPDFASGDGAILDARSGKELSRFRIPRPSTFAFLPDCASVYVVAFSQESKQSRFYQYNLATQQESELATLPVTNVRRPTVSPDGRWLAFQAGRPSDGSGGGIMMLSTETGKYRLAVPHPFTYTGALNFSFTPDSKRLIYARFINPRGWIFVDKELNWVPVEGGEPQPMGIRMFQLGDPSLNPDGKRLLFHSFEGRTDLWVLRNLPIR